MTTVLGLWRGHLTGTSGRPEFPVQDVSDSWVAGYMAARRSGALKPDDWRSSDSPRDGTLRNELAILGQACRWATGFRVDGRPLLDFDPTRSLSKSVKPVESNPKRPRLSPPRYARLLAVADEVDPRGMLRVLLTLAWHTGRRIGSVLHLRASDALRGEDQVRPALLAIGDDPDNALAWPVALRWRAEHDKKGREDVGPVNGVVAAALEAHVRRHAVVGDAWLFPSRLDASRPMNLPRAARLLEQAEEAAGLEKIERGAWHAFRRAWATARKALPMKDVMRVGGWRDPGVLQAAYQSSDPETALAVAELSA